MPKTLVEEVYENVHVLRVEDRQVKYFEGLWEIPEGVTYNAYLIVGREGSILLDGWKSRFKREFVDTLRGIVDLKDIKHLIVHHAEPDHTGTLPTLLRDEKLEPKIYGHTFARNILENLYHVKLQNFKSVGDNVVENIAGEKLLFIHTPLLHWPDTIMSFKLEGSILFSGDVFGGFSIPKSVFDYDEDEVSKFLLSARKYFVSVVGKYREHAVRGISKLKKLNLKPEIIAPLHGLIWKRNPRKIIESYEKWAKAIPEKKKVLIIYGSMYGSTEKAVEAVVETLLERGLKPVVAKYTDVHRYNTADLLGEAIDSEAIIIAAPTYESRVLPVIDYVSRMLVEKCNSEKPILILSSYGWGGVAGRMLKEIFQNSKFRIVDVIEFRGLPDLKVLEEVRKGVEGLINSLG